MREKVAVFALIFSTILFGFIGLTSRILFEAGLTPLEVSASRTVITLVSMGLIILFTDKSLFKIEIRDLWIFVFFGLCKLATDGLMFYAQSMISLSSASILQMTAPYYVVFLAFFLFGERITALKICSIVVGFAGCILVTDAFTDFEGAHLMGIIVGALSGLAFGLYSVGCKIATRKKYKPQTMIFYFFVFASIFIVPFTDVPSVVSIVVSDATVIVSMLILCLLMTVLPYYLHCKTLEVLEAGTASVILLMEAVVAAIVGGIFFGEAFSIINGVGMMMVFASIILIDRNQRINAESNST